MSPSEKKTISLRAARTPRVIAEALPPFDGMAMTVAPASRARIAVSSLDPSSTTITSSISAWPISGLITSRMVALSSCAGMIAETILLVLEGTVTCRYGHTQSSAAIGRTRTRKRKTPGRFRPGVLFRILAVTYSRLAYGQTTIGAERFHFRVRNGIGWFPPAMTARKTVARAARSQPRRPVRNVEKHTMCRTHGAQAPWVLYGQASRAISTG